MPTLMHTPGGLHATATGWTSSAPGGLGVLSSCQRPALKVSANAPVACGGPVVNETPTAAQRLRDGHATSTRTLLSAPGWSRLAVSVQWLPWERSATVNDPLLEALLRGPTATHERRGAPRSASPAGAGRAGPG